MKVNMMITLLQDILDKEGSIQVKFNGKPITGIWILPPNPTTKERHIALSTGTQTERFSVSTVQGAHLDK